MVTGKKIRVGHYIWTHSPLLTKRNYLLRIYLFCASSIDCIKMKQKKFLLNLVINKVKWP